MFHFFFAWFRIVIYVYYTYTNTHTDEQKMASGHCYFIKFKSGPGHWQHNYSQRPAVSFLQNFSKDANGLSMGRLVNCKAFEI